MIRANPIKINHEAPPDWLMSNHPRNVAIRLTLGGPNIPVCDCGYLLVGFDDNLPVILENCWNCYPDRLNPKKDKPSDPWEGYHGPSADDGTPLDAHGYCHTCSRPLTRVEGRDQSHVHDGTEIISKAYMSVDRNFRVTIHEGDDNGEVS